MKFFFFLTKATRVWIFVFTLLQGFVQGDLRLRRLRQAPRASICWPPPSHPIINSVSRIHPVVPIQSSSQKNVTVNLQVNLQ